LTKLEREAKRQRVPFHGDIIVDQYSSSEAKVVIEYANKNSYDLIVIGSRGRSKFKRIISGGVSNAVVDNSKIPVDYVCAAVNDKST
jgi:nucleotide-binding universal stress UspA family protein